MEGVTVLVVLNRIFLPQVQTVANEGQTISQTSQPAILLDEPSAVTDADGYYTIPDLAEGRYRLAAELEGILFTPAEQTVILPSTGVADFQVEIIDPKIPDTTAVLPESTTQYLQSISPDGSVLTFSQSTPELEELVPGDILLTDVNAAAPDGLLRKVTSVAPQGDDVVVTTEPAVLEEAVEDGAVYEAVQLTPADVTSVTALPGVQTSSPASPDSTTFYIEIPYEVVIYDKDGKSETKDDQVNVKGSIEFDLDNEFYLKIQNWNVKQFTLANTTTVTKEITVFVGTELSFEPDPYTIASYKFKPVTMWIGWVPVIVFPQLDLFVGMEGSVSVGISTGLIATATLRAGIIYTAASGWRTFSGITTGFEFVPPHLLLEASVEFYIGLRFSVYLYKVAGPYIEVKPFLELEVKPLDDPWWELFGGVKIPMGFRVEDAANKILKLDPVELLEVGVKFSLAQSVSDNTAPDAAEIVDPLHESQNQDINVDLQWTGSDPDDDVLNYEVYFGESNPPLLVNTRQSAGTYDPGTLNLSTDYYWKVVTWDEHGLSTASPIWKFTTPNSPPDAPSNPTPEMGAQNQPLYPMLGWQLSADPDPGDTVTYTVFLGTVYPPATIVSADQTTTDYQTSKLPPNTTHYWRVIARDNHGASASSPVWNFTTGDPVVPGEMVLIPAGNFQMGCDPAHNGGSECWYTEPLHTVYLDYYRIDRYEVTNAEYEECVNSGACSAPHYTDSPTRESYYGNPTYADYPVIAVTWYDVSTYCTWAGKRLPTEAEWEKAARGSGDTRPYPWGEQVPDCTLANIWSCLGDTSPVGNYPAGASPYGVMDMIGNVGEWVSDWYAWDYYSL